MQPCNYVKVTKCKVCEIPFHNQCKKFLQVHARWLLRKLLKDKAEAFKFTPIKGAEYYDVVYSRLPDVAKSLALQFALQKNEEITPFTSSVAMDLITRKMDIEAKVVYLHVKKAVGDKDTIVGMLESFCDWVVKDGGKVAIFLDECQAYNLKYKNVEDLCDTTSQKPKTEKGKAGKVKNSGGITRIEHNNPYKHLQDKKEEK